MRKPTYFPKPFETNYEFEEGETIEEKVTRIVENKEPITDGAPIIYTNRDDGIIAAYNIRTDRWDIAQAAMDEVHKQYAAKSKSFGVEVEKDEPKEEKTLDPENKSA